MYQRESLINDLQNAFDRNIMLKPNKGGKGGKGGCEFTLYLEIYIYIFLYGNLKTAEQKAVLIIKAVVWSSLHYSGKGWENNKHTYSSNTDKADYITLLVLYCVVGIEVSEGE